MDQLLAEAVTNLRAMRFATFSGKHIKSMKIHENIHCSISIESLWRTEHEYHGKKFVTGSVKNWRIIWFFWEQSTLIVKLTSHCAAGINIYSLIPTRVYELALSYSKSMCQRKTHHDFNSNKPGRTNRCVASRICAWPQCPRLKSPFLAGNP